MAAPDVLLLDEPTNHLDIDAIEWLQDLLNGWRGALVLVSHDRAFIDAVATRIVELDRGRLRSYPGNFAAFEAAKERELENEALADGARRQAAGAGRGVGPQGRRGAAHAQRRRAWRG